MFIVTLDSFLSSVMNYLIGKERISSNLCQLKACFKRMKFNEYRSI